MPPFESLPASIPDLMLRAAASSKPPLVDRVFILPNDHFSFLDSAGQIFGVIGPTHTLFTRSGVVVELKPATDGFSLAPLQPEDFRSRVEGYGRTVMAWRSDGEGGRVLGQKACSADSAKALLASRPAQELLPPPSRWSPDVPC